MANNDTTWHAAEMNRGVAIDLLLTAQRLRARIMGNGMDKVPGDAVPSIPPGLTSLVDDSTRDLAAVKSILEDAISYLGTAGEGPSATAAEPWRDPRAETAAGPSYPPRVGNVR